MTETSSAEIVAMFMLAIVLLGSGSSLFIFGAHVMLTALKASS